MCGHQDVPWFGWTWQQVRACVLVVGFLAIARGSIGWTQERAARHALESTRRMDWPVTAIAFSPDGQRLLCGSTGPLQILKWPDLGAAGALATSLETVLDLQFSPSGRWLLVAGGTPGESGVIEVWDWNRQQLLRKLALHDDAIFQCAWEGAERRWGTASFDGRCCVYDWEEGTVAFEFSGHSKGVLTIAAWDDRRWISAGVDDSIRLWGRSPGKTDKAITDKATTDKAITDKVLTNHLGDVLQIVPLALSNPPRLFSISEDRTIRMWHPEIGRMVRFERLAAVPSTACWDAENQEIVVGFQDGSICRRDGNTLAVSDTFVFPSHSIFELAIHPHDSRLAVSLGESIAVLSARPKEE